VLFFGFIKMPNNDHEPITMEERFVSGLIAAIAIGITWALLFLFLSVMTIAKISSPSEFISPLYFVFSKSFFYAIGIAFGVGFFMGSKKMTEWLGKIWGTAR
jgi:hypothetical protein